MDPRRSLIETARDALAVTGPITLRSADGPECVDRLVYASDGLDPGWGWLPEDLLPDPSSSTILAALDPNWEDAWLPVSEDLAGIVVERHLASWLLDRGWQSQVSIRKSGEQTWRLADCLAFADGGGDRLETDYPLGADRLAVLVASVLAVARFTFPAAGTR